MSLVPYGCRKSTNFCPDLLISVVKTERKSKAQPEKVKVVVQM